MCFRIPVRDGAVRSGSAHAKEQRCASGLPGCGHLTGVRVEGAKHGCQLHPSRTTEMALRGQSPLFALPVLPVTMGSLGAVTELAGRWARAMVQVYPPIAVLPFAGEGDLVS